MCPTDSLSLLLTCSSYPSLSSLQCPPYVFIVQCIQPTLLYLSLHVHPSFPSLSSQQCLPDVFIIQYVLPALLYLSIYMSIHFQSPFLQLLCISSFCNALVFISFLKYLPRTPLPTFCHRPLHIQISERNPLV